MPTWGVRCVLVTLMLLMSSCAAQSSVTDKEQSSLTDVEACQKLATVLGAANVGWPIAQNPSELRQQSLDQVRMGFNSVAKNSTTALGTHLKNWVFTLDKEIPYLLKNDETGFIQSVPPDEQKRFIEANIEITNTCQW
jgi:hypothetical protein